MSKSVSIVPWMAGAILLLSLSTPQAADPLDDPEGFSRESRQWVETVAGEGTIVVINPYGNVYSRFGGYADQVEILATFQRIDPELPQLEVSRTRTDGGLDIRVASAGEGETKDRVDLVLFVPQGVRLDARTEDGQIEAKGLKGDLVASSVKGHIRIRAVEGHVQAKSARGRISASLETGVTDSAQDLTTETGEIEVHLWEDADLDVRIATSGEISTDFSIDIKHERFAEPGKRGAATVGKGGSRLTLTSKRGDIRLLRLQKYFKPENGNRGNS